jgi:cell division protein FtsB
LRTRLLLGCVLLLGAAYFALFGGEYDFFELRHVRAERLLEEQRADEARDDVAALRARRDSLQQDSATIERLARERYGMIRDGERLYRFTGPDSARSAAAEAAARD